MPTLRIRQRPFKIPKTHSTSFLIDSNHLDQRNCLYVSGFLNGGTVVLQLRYPLSTIFQAPLCCFCATFPVSSADTCMDIFSSQVKTAKMTGRGTCRCRILVNSPKELGPSVLCWWPRHCVDHQNCIRHRQTGASVRVRVNHKDQPHKQRRALRLFSCGLVFFIVGN